MIKSYTLYTRNTGQIIQSGTCSNEFFNKKVIEYENNPDTGVISGQSNGNMQKVVNNEIITKSFAETGLTQEKYDEGIENLYDIENMKFQITNKQYNDMLNRISNLEKLL